MGSAKKATDEGGVLSFRDNIEEERRNRRREKQKKKKLAENVQPISAPQPELVQSQPKVGSFLSNNSRDSRGEEINMEDSLQSELMIEEVDVNVFLQSNLSPNKQMSGEEYFETNPNDNSFEINDSNRDLVTGPGDYTLEGGYDSAYKMISGDSIDYEL